ncbi:non-ribosomal peptide synthetase [Paenibacillus sp. UNC499MF]|uniref:non-ribosomal peptide synthetase n=1 Tax=Paenibacillus sp. UNC499MF TaxID=1502751 RepID=UPI0021560C73|nr:non-ribosomal peptide synthetase [Paenibacillus sp. UNC499MF]
MKVEQFQTLIDVIRDRGDKNSRGITFINGDQNEENITYGELLEDALGVLHHLQSSGMKAGDELLMQIDDNRSFLNVFWGCLLGGIIPVPVTVGNNDEHKMKLFKIWDTLNNPYLITEGKALEHLEKYALQNGKEDVFEKVREASLFSDKVHYSTGDKGVIHESKASDLAFIQFSSGSTGDPKGVMLTHENLIYNTRDMAVETEMGEKDAYLGWMPLTHDMGLIAFHLTCVMANSRQLIMPTALFIRRPSLWMKKASEHKVTQTCSPNFGYKFFLAQYKPENAADWDLSRLRLIYNGAEPISSELCDVFMETMSKHGLRSTAMFTVYGMAEASVGMSLPPLEENFRRLHLDREHLNIGEKVVQIDASDNRCLTFVDVGYPLRSSYIRICDDENRPLDDYVIGNIQIRGMNVTAGYYNNPEATAKVMTPDGWLITGDLGFMREGRLVITGRAKDIIFANGQNVYPHDIERVAEEVEGVELGKVAVCGAYDPAARQDRIIVFVMHTKKLEDFAPLAKRLKGHLNFRGGWDIQAVLPIRRIPKTTSGKVQRYKLAQDYTAGKFDETLAGLQEIWEQEKQRARASVIPRSVAEQKLLAIVKQILQVQEVDTDESYFDIGASSLQLVQIVEELETQLGVQVSVTDFFSYPTISKLAAFIAQGETAEDFEQGQSPGASAPETDGDIAIIGMSGKFPQADNLQQFWTNISEGRDCIAPYGEKRRKDAEAFISHLNTEGRDLSMAEGGYLDEIDTFDYSFFKLTPREASLMDPNQRLFLQTVWSAIEDAGYGGSNLSGRRVGVYVGFSKTSFEYERLLSEVSPASLPNFAIGNLSSIISSRISYLLDLKGPAVTVDTACSSSLVAVHLACKAILSGDCDMALAGGVKTILLPLKAGIGMESSDDRARAFDDSSDGTGWGEGVGVVFLKPLGKAIKDKDNILAVIKGSAINQDGSTVGISAPNASSQADVISQAWRNARIDPETVTYIEAHGTGTKLGDPVEIDGIGKAFRRRTKRKQFCAISTVKSNIGHLYEAAGIAGLIKTVLSLQHKQIAPSVHYRVPNRKISFEESPVYVNNRLKEWVTDGVPRRCGISSFGFSGTNCHVVLEEYNGAPEVTPAASADNGGSESGVPLLLTLSAKTEEGLQELIRDYDKLFAGTDELDMPAVCYTASTGRSHLTYRLAVTAADGAELMQKLQRLHREGKGSDGVYIGKTDSTQTHQYTQPGNLADLVPEAVQELARQYVQGASIDWKALYAQSSFRKVSLPTYPFQRKRCWIDVPVKAGQAASAAQPPHTAPTAQPELYLSAKEQVSVVNEQLQAETVSARHADSVRQTLIQMIGNVSQLSREELQPQTHFLELGLDSINLSQVRHSIKDAFGLDVPMSDFFESLTNLDLLTAYIVERVPQTEPVSVVRSEAAVQAPTAEAAAAVSQRTALPEPYGYSEQYAAAGAQGQIVAAAAPGPVASIAGSPASSAVERILEQQLQLMSQQLQVLGSRPAVQAPLPVQPAAVPGPSPDARVAAAPSAQPVARPHAGTTREVAAAVETRPAALQGNGEEPKPYVPYKALDLKARESLSQRQEKHVRELIERYTARTGRTKAYTQQYRDVYANNRNVAGFRPLLKEMVYQIISERAEGSKLWDLDGNEYVDLTMGFGVNLFGHNPSFVREKIERELANGMCVGPMSNLAGQVAESICRMTGVERIALYNSGTEAVMVALRLARAATGRDKVVIFAGSYHGTFDGVLALGSAGTNKEHSTPLAPGILQNMVDDIVVLNYGSEDSLEYIRSHAHELAAVVVEPVQSRRPDFQPKAFLEEIRRITNESRTAFIFDEVITGFRLHPGGAQAWFGIKADLVTYGKVIGGGMPIGIVAGSSAYMDGIDGGTWKFGDDSFPQNEHRRTFVAGTFCHHPLAMAASLAVLNHLEASAGQIQADLNARTARFAEELNTYFGGEGVPIKVVHFGSLFRFVLKGDLELFYYHMLDKGIYIWEGRNCFLSTAHSEEDIARIVQAVKESVGELRKGGFLPDRDPSPDDDNPSGRKLPSGRLTESGQGEAFPLTPDQKQLWFASVSNRKDSPSLHETALLRFRGALRADAFEQAVRLIAGRHEALRLVISLDGETQIVRDSLDVKVPVVDLAGLNSTEQERQIGAWLHRESQTPFDLERETPLFRVRLLRTSAESHTAVFTFHHLIADGWSMALFVQELERIYSALVRQEAYRLPEPAPFRTYAAWQSEQLEKPQSAQAAAYWNGLFEKQMPVVELPSPVRGTILPTSKGGRHTAVLPATLVQELKKTSIKLGSSLFVTLLSGFHLFLHRLTGQNDITVGVPTAGQAQMEAPFLMGNCVNLLPVLSRASSEQSFASYAGSVKQRMNELDAYQAYSFAALAERGLRNLPVLTAVFNMDRPLPKLDFHGLDTELLVHDPAYCKYELFLNVTEISKELRLDFDYNADLFQPETVETWSRYFIRLLESIADGSDKRLPELSLLSAEESERVWARWALHADENGNYECILDAYKYPAPPGTIGEVYAVSGRKVESPSNRFTSTGKWAYSYASGAIKRLGKTSRSVLVRGHRVYLDQIEEHLLHTLRLEACAVTAHFHPENETVDYMTAYVVANPSKIWKEIEKFSLLHETLPDYAIPRYLIPMAELPLLPDGEIDFTALPAPSGGNLPIPGKQNLQGSATDKLIAIWKDVLGAAHINTGDNFFQLGGDSLKATVILSRINKEFGVHIPLSELFALQTVGELEQYITGGSGQDFESIQPVPQEKSYPVSSAQKRMYVLDQLGGGGTAYNVPGRLFIEGEVDRERLIRALRQASARHESFRTYFGLENGEVVQKIAEEAELDVPVSTVRAEEMEELQRQFVRPFDLGQAPLFRAHLFELETGGSVLLIDVHHAVADGYSMAVLLDEFIQIYQGRLLPPRNVHYKDFAVWQNGQLAQGKFGSQEAFWLQTLAGELPVLQMPTDYPRPASQSFKGNSFVQLPDRKLTEALYSLAKDKETTLYMVLLAAYNVLLAKYSGQEDIIVGTPAAGRRHADTESMAGMFVNTLAIRSKPEPSLAFGQFLQEVKRGSLAAFENQEYPFEEIVEKLQLVRDLSRNPLFDTIFSLQNVGTDVVKTGGLSFKPGEFNTGISKVDFSLHVTEQKDGLLFTWEYATDLFARETVERLARHYSAILETIAYSADIPLGEIQMLTAPEKEDLITGFNDTAAEFPMNVPVHKAFEEQAAKAPEAAAVVFGDRSLTYRELNERADAAARKLRELGIGPDKLVGLMMPRSAEMIIGQLAVLKAGGAYVPIDPDYPPARVLYMLQDSEAGVLLTSRSLIEGLDYDGSVLFLDEDDIYQNEGADLDAVGIESKHLAYVIYTSGSTGNPKGVMLPHRSVMNFVTGMREVIDFRPDKKILSLTTISFDIFVLESLVPLLTGMTVVIGDRQHQLEAEALGELIRSQEIDMLQMTPSRLQMLLASEEGKKALAGVKDIMVGGEALPHALLEQLQSLDGLKIYNMYGPTETTVWSAVRELTGAARIDIGRPIANTQVYIVDANSNLQPVGVPGELCIAGEGLARGYWKRENLTAEKFVPNPFDPGTKMYKTGDLARWKPDGNLEFLGRIDHQVKVRGFRIELGEIENALIKLPSVQEAAVKVHASGGHEAVLCGYVVPKPDSVLSAGEVREQLARQLPYYSVPSHFIFLDKLPLTPNGKTDRKSLPEPDDLFRPDVEYAPPRNEVEEALAGVWQDVLGRTGIGIHDNFFLLGGDSIKGIQVVARMRAEGYALDIKQLFEHPSIGDLGAYVTSSVREIAQGHVGGEVALTPVQNRFFEQGGYESDSSLSALLFSAAGLEEDHVRSAWDRVLEQHDALRLRAVLKEGELKLEHRSLTEEPAGLSVIRLSGDKSDVRASVERQSREIESGLSLKEGPLVRGVLFQTGEGDYLLIAIHRLITDDTSFAVILEDLDTVYGQLVKGENVSLPLKTDAFLTWAEHLRKYAENKQVQTQREYWASAAASGEWAVPVDREHEAGLPPLRNSVCAVIPADKTSELLTGVKDIYSMDAREAILSALGKTFGNWAGLNRFLIELTEDGRKLCADKKLDFSRTVGWFDTQYPLVLDNSFTDDLAGYLKQVKESVRQVPDGGIGYGALYDLASSRQQEEGTAARKHPPIGFVHREPSVPVSPYFDPLNAGEGITGDLRAAREYGWYLISTLESGALTLRLDYNGHAYTEQTASDLLHRLEENLYEVLRHCQSKTERELTPADVGANDLDLDEFEDIKQFYESV